MSHWGARLLGGVALGVTMGSVASAEARFYEISGPGPPRSQARAQAMADDALVVVGYSAHPLGGRTGFYWDPVTGTAPLPLLPGTDDALGEGVSSDGRVIVGRVMRPGRRNTAVVWHDLVPTMLSDLPNPLEEVESLAFDVADETGDVFGFSDGVAVRWVDGAVERIDPATRPPFARLIQRATPDGRYAVGTATILSGGFSDEAIRWSETDGLLYLGSLPGVYIRSDARDLSEDGAVVVGTSSPNGSRRAFRWEDGVMQELPGLPRGSPTFASAVSGDGSVIVGNSQEVSTRTATIWRDREVRAIQEILEGDGGLDLSGWHLTDAVDVDRSGRVVLGLGRSPNGIDESWLAILPLRFEIRVLDGIPAFPSLGLIRIAVYGSPDVDVRELLDLRAGPDDAEPIQGPRYFDLDGDGFEDRIDRYRSSDLGLAPDADEICVSARVGEEDVSDCDSIPPLRGCGGGFAPALVLPGVVWWGSRRRRGAPSPSRQKLPAKTGAASDRDQGETGGGGGNRTRIRIGVSTPESRTGIPR